MAISWVANAEGSAINGGDITITLPTSSMQEGDVVIVTNTVPINSFVFSVTSSSTGTGYTQIVPTVETSLMSFGVFRRIMGATVDTQVRCLGSAVLADGDTAVVQIFRGVDQTTPEDVTPTSTTGSGTTPNSPSITVANANCAILTCVGANENDTAVTAPSSFLNQVDINANDTDPTTSAMAWITHTSTSAFDPASWTSFLSSPWCSATVALRPATDTPYGWAHGMLTTVSMNMKRPLRGVRY